MQLKAIIKVCILILLAGCSGRGKMASDSSALNDIWILKAINGKPVEIPESKLYPTLEVDLPNNRFSGYGGCNRFHGTIMLEGETLKTGNTASTKMACLDTGELESVYLNIISNKTLYFRIENDKALKISDGIFNLEFERAN